MTRFKTTNTATAELTLSRFNAMQALMAKETSTKFYAALDAYLDGLGKDRHQTLLTVQALAAANDALVRETQNNTKRNNPFDKPVENEDPLHNLRRNTSENNFIRMIFDVVAALLDGYSYLQDAGRGFQASASEGLAVPAYGEKSLTTLETHQLQAIRFQIGAPVVEQFLLGVFAAESAPNIIVSIGRDIVRLLDRFYSFLQQRHTIGGLETHGDPVITDLALSIYENVDANGEIQDGVKADEVSAYSMNRAVLIASTLRIGLVGKCLDERDFLMAFIEEHLLSLWGQATALSKMARPLAEKCRAIFNNPWAAPALFTTPDFEVAVAQIRTLDPQGVIHKPKSGLMSKEERKELAFRNETIGLVVAVLKDGSLSTEDLIRLVLQRKQTLREYHLIENSFFQCKIGAGNQFQGEAPGQLQIVPGSKPNVDLTDIVGSGFAEVRDFIGNLKHGSAWTNLFLATSPSKKSDKSNVLLVGPQGCGKTEVLRAVGSDPDSISIFAQASDFLTCWKGEAEKNPKRLFEGGLKLQRESGRDVHFLIDEIDTILNDEKGQNAFGGFNLATEFQVLMDGVMSYPGLSVWGATNHLDRIPMPLIRRFAKVVIVGELDKAQRVHLLQHFTNFLPVSGSFSDSAWEGAADKLKGAVGDIIRKVVDDLWRTKMSGFVSANPAEAEKLGKWLTLDGTEKFDIATFTPERRGEFKAKLRSFLEVTPDDLHQTVDRYLGNLAIQAEIAKCQQTYDGARQALASLAIR